MKKNDIEGGNTRENANSIELQSSKKYKKENEAKKKMRRRTQNTRLTNAISLTKKKNQSNVYRSSLWKEEEKKILWKNITGQNNAGRERYCEGETRKRIETRKENERFGEEEEKKEI